METVSIIEPNDDTSIYREESLFLKDFYLADDTLILFEDDHEIYSYDKNKGFTRHRVVTCDLEKEYISDIRGTYVGDTFYTVVFGNKMIATDLNTMEELGIYEFGE